MMIGIGTPRNQRRIERPIFCLQMSLWHSTTPIGRGMFRFSRQGRKLFGGGHAYLDGDRRPVSCWVVALPQAHSSGRISASAQRTLPRVRPSTPSQEGRTIQASTCSGATAKGGARSCGAAGVNPKRV